jgi:Zn-dependent M28 family amino/carboxypeptidase
MHRAKERKLIRYAACLLLLAMTACAKDFDGKAALEYTRKVVEFGPRPPASPAIRKLQAYILAQLKLHHCEVTQDDFTAQTPVGPVAMKNIIARFPGKSGRAIVLTGHYDTKVLPNFVGADDGGSSTGFLLEMAAILDGAAHKDDIYLVWFDGEEAYKEWTATDSVYGSRHLAQKWASQGFLGRIKALINIDMIGDADLDILRDGNSSQSLIKLIWETAENNGYGQYFTKQMSSTEDDHIPFVRLRVNAADVIDLDYRPWHTPQDTMDKLSAHSFQVVGDVIVAVLKQLEDMR